MNMAGLVQKIGKSVQKIASTRGTDWWYTPHMAAASRAIFDRIPLVDLILDVRDARIPLSSEHEQLSKLIPSSRHIIVLNKKDLANPSQTKEWLGIFQEQNFTCFAVNSHNRENVQELLKLLQTRIRELKKMDLCLAHTVTLMLAGIPNVGKSALANSLHQIGRISAEGAIKDSVAGVTILAEYFLSILNSSDEFKKWAKLSPTEIEGGTRGKESANLNKRQKRQYPTDHTQDFMVNNARCALYEAVSSFTGRMQEGGDMDLQLVENEFKVLQEVFHLPGESAEANFERIAAKLLNLYRTGRLGHYTLDFVPSKVVDISI